MKSQVICGALNTVNPTPAQRARMRAALEAQLPAELPWNVSVSDIACLVHAERAMTSRAVSRMAANGLLERSGRRLLLKTIPPAARLWWDS